MQVCRLRCRFPAPCTRGGGGRRQAEKQEACQKEERERQKYATPLNTRRFFCSGGGGARELPEQGKKGAEKIYRMVENAGTRAKKRGREGRIGAEDDKKNQGKQGGWMYFYQMVENGRAPEMPGSGMNAKKNSTCWNDR